MATLSGQTIANTFDSLLHVEDDTAGLVATSTDSRVIQDGVGANSALALATDSVRITSTNKLYFNDVGGEYISGNGAILSIVGGDEIDLTATAIDINGTVDMSSTVTFNGVPTISASGGAVMKLHRDDSSIVDGNDIGQIEFTGADPSSVHSGAMIRGEAAGEWTTDNENKPTELQFFTQDAGDGDGMSSPNMVIDKDGNVGIGTSAPAYTLDLASSESIVSQFTGSGGETILSLDNTSTNGDKWYLISGGSGGSFAGGKFGIYNADTTTEVATFANDGNVGIGVTDSDAKLEVNAGTTNTTCVHIDRNFSGDAGSYLLHILAGANETTNAALFVQQSGSGPNSVFNGGNVGIGQTSPSSATGMATFLHIGSSSHASAGLILEDNENKWEIECNGSFTIHDGTDNRFRIDPSGNVGIAMTPGGSHKLDVTGSAGLSTGTRRGLS
mgnify:CR=1 FL=1